MKKRSKNGLSIKNMPNQKILKTCLVTGGAGFIGSHLVDKLIEKNYKVVVVDDLSGGKKENLPKKAKFYKVDILSPKIEEIFKKEKPKIVFHLAAKINLRKSIQNPIKDAKVNILGSLNVIENFLKLNFKNLTSKKFIFASTGGAIYGNAKIFPTPEKSPPLPFSPYGVSKLAIEKYLQYYQQVFGLDFISLRLANVYGPRQNPKGEAGVVAIFFEQILKNKTPKIFGSGNQTRDFIFVKDVVEAFLKALDYQGKKRIFNIGTGKETSVNEILKKISQILKKKIKAKYLPQKKGDLQRSCLDIALAKKHLKWQPKYHLKEGLRETALYFLEKMKK